MRNNSRDVLEQRHVRRTPARLPRTPSPPHHSDYSLSGNSNENLSPFRLGGDNTDSDPNDPVTSATPTLLLGSSRKRRTLRQSQAPTNKKLKASVSISSFVESERDILDYARDQMWISICRDDAMLDGIPLLIKAKTLLELAAQKFHVVGK